MNLKKFLVSTALAVAGSVAFAQDSAPIPLTLVSSGTNLLGTTFQRSVTGLFVDVFSFMPTSVQGTVSVSLVPSGSSINFYAALLNSQGFSFFPENGISTFSFQSAVDSTTPLSLTVFGYSGDPLVIGDASGTYSGTIQVQAVAAVPEPQTYALLVAGLGVLGAVRKRSTSAKRSCA